MAPRPSCSCVLVRISSLRMSLMGLARRKEMAVMARMAAAAMEGMRYLRLRTRTRRTAMMEMAVTR